VARRLGITLALVSRQLATLGKPRVPRPAHHLLPQPTEEGARLFLTSSAHAQRSFVRASRSANSPSRDAGLAGTTTRPYQEPLASCSRLLVRSSDMS
jgi:hypothetical protein